MQGDKSLPLFVFEGFATSLALAVIHFDALALDHNQSSIDALDLSDELLLRDRASLRLPYHGDITKGWRTFGRIRGWRTAITFRSPNNA